MKALINSRMFAAVIITCAGGSLACAHAFLNEAEPKVGSEVAVSPAEVCIWFTDEIAPAASGIQVLDQQGKQVDKKDFHVDPNDVTLGIVSLPPLSPGKYNVVWHAVTADTHKTQGDFTFTVRASRPSPATATHTATAPATARSPSKTKPANPPPSF